MALKKRFAVRDASTKPTFKAFRVLGARCAFDQPSKSATIARSSSRVSPLGSGFPAGPDFRGVDLVIILIGGRGCAVAGLSSEIFCMWSIGRHDVSRAAFAS